MSKKPSANDPSIVSTPVGKRLQRVTQASTGTPRSVRTDAGKAKNTKIREIIAQNMNDEMVECYTSDFLAQYGAAKVPTAMIKGCIAHLAEKELLTNGTWSDFPTAPANMQGQIENDCFKPLGSIVKEIFAYAGKNRQNDYIFKMLPNARLSSDIPGSNHMMDACLVEEDKDKGPWPNHQMIAPMEAKKGDTDGDIKTVREQIVGDCYHILCDDPRRMFIYGMTFANNRMNLWYFSRTHSVKTRSVDWLEGDGLYQFVHFMLSLALAKPQDLGIDPYVHKANGGSGGQQYVYELDVPLNPPAPSQRVLRSDSTRKEKLYFKTLRILSRERPMCITTRMTRVWVVQQVEDVDGTRVVPGSQEVILKDVWIDSDDPTETKNLEDIFIAVDKFVEDAQKKAGGLRQMIDDLYPSTNPDFKLEYENSKARLVTLLTDKNYRRLFLTTLHTCEGQQTKAVQRKVVRTPKVPVFRSGSTSAVAEGSRTVGSVNPSHQTYDDSNKPSAQISRNYAQKTQRRFVYKEVCTTSYDLPTLGDALDIIRQVLDASQILYCAGWVHRDISVGNILAVKHTVNGINHFSVKLSDFEFAQKKNTTKHHTDPRTGTLHFMPVEIMKGHYLVESIRDREYSATQVSLPSGDASKPKRKLTTRGQDPATEAPVKNAWGITPDHPLYETLNGFTPFKALLPVPKNATPDIPAQDKGVNHNYQHDLESIWWIIVYFITTLVDHKDSHDLGKKWFSSNPAAADSRMVFFSMLGLDSSFDKALRPELKDVFPDSLDLMRKTLHNEYIYKEVYGLLGDDRTYTFAFMEMAAHVNDILSTRDQKWSTLKIKKYEAPVEDTPQGSLPIQSTAAGASTSGSPDGSDDNPFL